VIIDLNSINSGSPLGELNKALNDLKAVREAIAGELTE
jgi:hypothetical protein